MKKQVVFYSGQDAWECKLCIYSEEVLTKEKGDTVYLCHKNKMKFFEEPCPDLTTNDKLIKQINEEKI